MCGIFGLTVHPSAAVTSRDAALVLRELFVLSESRGKEASGLAWQTNGATAVCKAALPAHQFISTTEFEQTLQEGFRRASRETRLTEPFAAIGHSRLVTNGSLELAANNQPVAVDGVMTVHNGIVVNDAQLWAEHPSLVRRAQVDTEIIAALFADAVGRGSSSSDAASRLFAGIDGTASIAILCKTNNQLLLATNNGSLYTAGGPGLSVFASERYILAKMMSRRTLRHLFTRDPVPTRVDALSGIVIDLQSGACEPLRLPHGRSRAGTGAASLASRAGVPDDAHELEKRFPIDRDRIRMLARCRRCILPATTPFITFDEEGICNYCRHYRRRQRRPMEELQQQFDARPRRGDVPDCLVTFSGGRDSSYGLHVMRTVLNLRPVAYTYDWGMITDLARRNQARLCGKLGVEHIIVSADIRKKRDNIRKNVVAWLRRPDLGMVPLFMAGDKQYFYYANMLRRQTGAPIVVLCENLLETTAFKSGFCGVPPTFGSDHTYTLSLGRKLRLLSYYAGQFVGNRSYFNSSMIDTLGAFASYYVIPHDYLNLYDYVKWDEATIDSTLIDEYGWETAPDTPTTWRIGDGTAAFYNYIYYRIAGFSENDTFRSNQVREGVLKRAEAMQLATLENEPRYEALHWYFDTLQLDLVQALERIHSVPVLY